MADDTKLNYSSAWEIDQLVATDSVSVSSGTTTIYTIPATSSLLPPTVFQVQFQPSGSSSWFMSGTNSTDGTLANSFTFYSYFSSSSISVNTTSAGTARYFVWSDGIVH